MSCSEILHLSIMKSQKKLCKTLIGTNAKKYILFYVSCIAIIMINISSLIENNIVFNIINAVLTILLANIIVVTDSQIYNYSILSYLLNTRLECMIYVKVCKILNIKSTDATKIDNILDTSIHDTANTILSDNAKIRSQSLTFIRHIFNYKGKTINQEELFNTVAYNNTMRIIGIIGYIVLQTVFILYKSKYSIYENTIMGYVIGISSIVVAFITEYEKFTFYENYMVLMNQDSYMDMNNTVLKYAIMHDYNNKISHDIDNKFNTISKDELISIIDDCID